MDGLEKQQKFFVSAALESESAVKASYRISHIIAKHCKPFSDGEYIRECLMVAAEDITPGKKEAFSRISITRNTVASRIVELGQDIERQLNQKCADFQAFSLSFDESTDIGDTAQLCIFLRGVDKSFKVHEEILSISAMHGTTKGSDIFDAVTTTIATRVPGLQWQKLAGLTTDRAPATTGKNSGAVSLIMKMVKEKWSQQEVISFHCIIHQEVLCGKGLKLDHVMQPVVKTVNHIRCRGANHRQFKTFLEEVEAEYGDLLYHADVHWLSRRKVLERFFALRIEIQEFLRENAGCRRGIQDTIALFSSNEWLFDLAFLVDITRHLNMLNTNLQRRNQLVTDMVDCVCSFRQKIGLFKTDFMKGVSKHFPSITELLSLNTNISSMDCYVQHLNTVEQNFAERFQDFKIFKMEADFQLFRDPFAAVVENYEDPDLQLELIDVKNNSFLKAKFKEVSLVEFYSFVNCATYPLLFQRSANIASLFGSTYLCEQTFSVMTCTKSKHRSRLTDEHLDASVRLAVSSTVPDFQFAVAGKRCQFSGKAQ